MRWQLRWRLRNAFCQLPIWKLQAASKIGNSPALFLKAVFMSLKRRPTDDEIEALAELFRPLWRQGDIMRPWLRQHHDMLLAWCMATGPGPRSAQR